jgi:hypothetical protein
LLPIAQGLAVLFRRAVKERKETGRGTGTSREDKEEI